VKRSVLLATTSLVCAVALAACTSETPGFPSGTAAGVTTGQSSASASSGTAKPKPPLANVEPCSLLGGADVSALGLKDQKADIKAGLYRGCNYRYSASTGSAKVVIFDELGITDVTDRGQLTQLSVGKHEANQGVSPGGACVIAIKITDKSRVDVSIVSGDGDEKKACQLVLPTAQAVEKNLPSS
jgi:hypothetical protein